MYGIDIECTSYIRLHKTKHGLVTIGLRGSDNARCLYIGMMEVQFMQHLLCICQERALWVPGMPLSAFGLCVAAVCMVCSSVMYSGGAGAGHTNRLAYAP